MVTESVVSNLPYSNF